MCLGLRDGPQWLPRVCDMGSATASLEAAIFDVYGTFDDSDEARRNAFNTAFREFGLDWEWGIGLYFELLAVAGGKEDLRHYCRGADPGRLQATDTEAFVAALRERKTRLYRRTV